MPVAKSIRDFWASVIKVVKRPWRKHGTFKTHENGRSKSVLPAKTELNDIRKCSAGSSRVDPLVSRHARRRIQPDAPNIGAPHNAFVDLQCGGPFQTRP